MQWKWDSEWNGGWPSLAYLVNVDPRLSPLLCCLWRLHRRWERKRCLEQEMSSFMLSSFVQWWNTWCRIWRAWRRYQIWRYAFHAWVKYRPLYLYFIFLARHSAAMPSPALRCMNTAIGAMKAFVYSSSHRPSQQNRWWKNNSNVYVLRPIYNLPTAQIG